MSRTLTFLAEELGREADDISDNEALGFHRVDGMLYRQGDVISKTGLFYIPHTQQSKTHVHRPDHQGAITGAFSHLHQVIPAERDRERTEQGKKERNEQKISGFH